MSRAGVVPPPADLVAWALHCNGQLEEGGSCFAVFQLAVPFRTTRALRRAARKKGWRVGLTPNGVIDLCPKCYEAERKKQEKRERDPETPPIELH